MITVCAMKPPLLAKYVFACFLPLAAHGQIIMQTTEPDDMLGVPIDFGSSASGLSLSNTATVETPATPASAQPMVLGEENRPQSRQFTPEFDVSERYSLESTKEKKKDPPLPAQTPSPISPNLNPTTEPQSLPTSSNSPTTQPSPNSPNPQNVLLGQPQPPLTGVSEPNWQGNNSTISATQPFTLSPAPPSSISLQPDPTPAATE